MATTNIPSALLSVATLLIGAAATVATARDFDFFYFVQQWPGAYCDAQWACCYPLAGKPAANFSIHGLWPNYEDGSYPENCNPGNPFDPSQIGNALRSEMQKSWPSLACPSSNSMSFWAHEWEKHGTCSESVLDQNGYFRANLALNKQVDILGILQNAGIRPDDGFYNLSSISEAIEAATGNTPGITCNRDSSDNSQLYEVFMCVDKSGKRFIECPVLPSSDCPKKMQFQSFGIEEVYTSR